MQIFTSLTENYRRRRRSRSRSMRKSDGHSDYADENEFTKI